MILESWLVGALVVTGGNCSFTAGNGVLALAVTQYISNMDSQADISKLK